MDKLKSKLIDSSVLRFIVVGSLNTGVDLTIFFVIANLLHFPPVPSSLASTGITMCLSFFLNHQFVFHSGKRRRDTLVHFVAITLLNVWVVQSLIIAFTIHGLNTFGLLGGHLWTINLVGKLSGVAVSMVMNFVMYKYIFHKPVSEEIKETVVA